MGTVFEQLKFWNESGQRSSNKPRRFAMFLCWEAERGTVKVLMRHGRAHGNHKYPRTSHNKQTINNQNFHLHLQNWTSLSSLHSFLAQTLFTMLLTTVTFMIGAVAANIIPYADQVIFRNHIHEHDDLQAGSPPSHCPVTSVQSDILSIANLEMEPLFEGE